MRVEWPEIKPIRKIINPPEPITQASNKDLFLFRDADGQIIFVQVRMERGGRKAYIPFTYWDDDTWRMIEPDGQLPLYNLDKLRDAAVVFIHEGAKAARRMQAIVDNVGIRTRSRDNRHPWHDEMATGAHVGWAGGAHAVHRTDWSPVNGNAVQRAYIVADNDVAGRNVVPAISRKLQVMTFCVQFTDEFPAGFDLGDDFPNKLFGSREMKGFYSGPIFRDCLHPATWATDVIPNPSPQGGRPLHVLRESIRGMWAFVEESDVFVCKEMPEILRREALLNKILAPFSDIRDTSRLIVKAYQGRTTRICYAPEHSAQMVTWRGSSAINLHIPSRIKSIKGSYAPWEDFLGYMFPNPMERKGVEKWCATLIARPDIRMGYAMLLVSEHTGIGKTTLGAHILAPLVGSHNVSFPGENDISSDFNAWVANKRLAVVSEIYTGHSWRVYNILKGIITDFNITVNEKYMPQYTIQNWCHIFASSNSMRALRMEQDDRRWFYPEVTEKAWPKARFDAFRTWIEGGGLGVIRWWAENHGDYVMPSDRAPMTRRKEDMIEDSRSDAQKEAASVAEGIANREAPMALTVKDVIAFVRANTGGRIFDSNYELRRTMVEEGMVQYNERIKLFGRSEYIILNKAAANRVYSMEDPNERRRTIRNMIARCSDIIEEDM